MSFALDLDPFIDRIRATGHFKTVEGVLAVADIRKEHLLALPAAFVLPESESATTNQIGTGAFEQIVTTMVGVVIVVGADGARKGTGGSTLHRAENCVGPALVAARIDGLARPVEYADARLFGVSPGRVSRLLRFRAVRRLRVERSYP